MPPASGATGWRDLDTMQQTRLQALSWDFFVREYLTAALRAIKAVVPAGMDLGVWNWPFKFWRRASAPQWDGWMDELGWLWAELPVLLPDLYPEFYAGPVGSRPAALSTCTAQDGHATTDYFQSNVDNALRLKRTYNPAAKVVLSVWWHYMCAQKITGDLGYFVDDGNLAALFGVVGIDGIAIWGSIGTSTGEDANATEVAGYLNSVWAPHLASRCRALALADE